MATRFDVTTMRSSPGSATRGVRRIALGAWLGPVARAVVVLTATLALTSCVRVYYADPIKARVVDAATGAPVEGVNVLAAWQAKGGLEGGNITGYVKVMEDVTNANGEFSFPGWGPKVWMNGGIRDGAPLLILFKPGYDATLLWERKYGVDFAPSHMSSSWEGREIPLKKFVGAVGDYSVRLAELQIYTGSIVRDGRCAWRSMPRFLWAIDQQHREFVAAKAPVRLYGLAYLNDLADRSCGSLEKSVVEQGR